MRVALFRFLLFIAPDWLRTGFLTLDFSKTLIFSFNWQQWCIVPLTPLSNNIEIVLSQMIMKLFFCLGRNHFFTWLHLDRCSRIYSTFRKSLWNHPWNFLQRCEVFTSFTSVWVNWILQTSALRYLLSLLQAKCSLCANSVLLLALPFFSLVFYFIFLRKLTLGIILKEPLNMPWHSRRMIKVALVHILKIVWWVQCACALQLLWSRTNSAVWRTENKQLNMSTSLHRTVLPLSMTIT